MFCFVLILTSLINMYCVTRRRAIKTKRNFKIIVQTLYSLQLIQWSIPLLILANTCFSISEVGCEMKYEYCGNCNLLVERLEVSTTASTRNITRQFVTVRVFPNVQHETLCTSIFIAVVVLIDGGIQSKTNCGCGLIRG